MDLTRLENALNNGDFKEQVYSSLNGIYQISKVLDQLDLLKNFSDHDLEIVGKIQALKSALKSYETSEQELKAKIDALKQQLEAKKQELKTRLNMDLESTRASETQKLNEAGNALKTQLIAFIEAAKDSLEKELEAKKQEVKTRLNMQLIAFIEAAKASLKKELEALDASIEAIKPQMQGVIKFLDFFVYGFQTFFVNPSDRFMELFELQGISLQANKNYIVQFSMPFELSILDRENMGEIVLCLKANSKVYPIINSFYQPKTIILFNNKIVNCYKVDCPFKTPSEQVDYKIAVFARRYKDLWVNVNYSTSTHGFETSFLNNAEFDNFTTQSLSTDYSNDRVFYKHSQALVYEIL
ncbi:hypothetical protein HpVH12_14570 [Helicobacter pylori]